MKVLIRIAIVIIALIVFWIITIGISHMTMKKKQIKPFVKHLSRTSIAGHRGFSGKYPGNTIKAFKATLNIDPNALLEMDVWQTKDKRIVVIHDGDLKHSTNATGPVRRFTLQEIKKLDAGYKTTFDKGKTYPFRGRGYRIPTLEEVLKAFPKVLISIDIKYHTIDCAERVIALVKQYNAEEYVIISSFSSKIIKHVRKKHSQFATCFGRSGIINFFVLHTLHISGFFRPEGDVFMIPEFSNDNKPEYLGPNASQGFRIITKRFIKDAQKLGIPVFAWTINRKSNMKRLLKWGIDGIITDYPDKTAQALQEIKKKH